MHNIVIGDCRGLAEMSHSGWVDVWKLALAIVAREPVYWQIATGLGVAFAAAMCLEGIYASFLPLRYAARLARNYQAGLPPPAAREQANAPSRDMPALEPAAPRSPRRALRPNRKRVSVLLSPHRPTKPLIRRKSVVNAPSLPDYAMAPAAEAATEL